MEKFGESIETSFDAAAFGWFDGMHKGHRAVLERLSKYRNPVVVLFPDDSEEVVYTEAEKKYVLKSFGIENVICGSCDSYDDLNLRTFVADTLVGGLGVGQIVIGENCPGLTKLCEVCKEFGVAVEIVPTVKDNDKAVTTDLVRTSLRAGNIEECIGLLGGAFVICGEVVHGKGVGKKHGLPTANLQYACNKVWPKHGVYGARVCVGEALGKINKGMTNIGLRPSDDESDVPTCETFILDFDRDIYGTCITLELFKYVRPVIKFSSLDEVKAQVEKDIKSI